MTWGSLGRVVCVPPPVLLPHPQAWGQLQEEIMVLFPF